MGSRRSRYLAVPGTGDESDSAARQVFVMENVQEPSSHRAEASDNHAIVPQRKAVLSVLEADHRSLVLERPTLALYRCESRWRATPCAPDLGRYWEGHNQSFGGEAFRNVGAFARSGHADWRS